MISIGAALALAFTGLAAGAPAPGDGVVLYATRARVYVDVGRADGVELGAELRVVRGGSPIATCRVDHLAEHQASCLAANARAQDEVRFVPIAGAATPGVQPARSATAGPSRVELTPEESERLRGAIAASPFQQVEDHAAAGTEIARRLEVVLGARHDSYLAISGTRDGFHRERVDLALRDLPIGLFGAAASIELTALAWSARPEPRFRSSAAQLYVFETGVYAREDGSEVTAAVGRVHPWHTPGLFVLDGVQVGWRPRGTRVELGVAAGAVPDVVTLEPTSERWIGDAYWSIEAGEDGTYLASEGRVGVARAPEPGTVGEVESTLSLRLPDALAATAGGHAVIGAGGLALVAASGALEITAIADLRIGADARTRTGGADVLQPALGILAGEHGAVYVRSEHISWLHVGASGGFGHLRADDRTRWFAGPEVELPRGLGEHGSLALGWHEAGGFAPGRTAWAQAYLHFGPRVDLLARVSWLEDRVEGGSLQDLAAYGALDWRVADRLRLRATIFTSTPFSDLDRMASPIGLHGRVGVAGVLP